MKYYPHPAFAREGWPFIAISSSLALIVFWLTNLLFALPFILLALFIWQFFRDPARVIPQEPGIVVSPADGKIVAIEETYDSYQNVEAIKISIFMNIFNVHSNRSPIDGEVIDMHYFPGKFINAKLNKASSENERNALIIQTADGYRVTCVQIAGLIARRILCYTKVGEWLKRGERYGFIRFGSRVDIYLPLSFLPLVTIGQKVKATETILAKMA